MAGKGPLSWVPFLLLLLPLHFPVSVSAVSEADTLLFFKSSLSTNAAALNSWAQGSAPCNGNVSNWASVLCYNGYVWGLQLENMGLTGQLHLESLVPLPGLRTISFMRNNLVGPIPDVSVLAGLKNVYLSDNQFSGEIPDGIFSKMRWLKKVHLSGNDFSGKIPSSLSGLNKLLEVRLDGNQFTGVIPDLRMPGLKLVNMSYNNLEGMVPESLARMPASAFEGNENLCGAPLDVECEVLSPTELPRPKRRMPQLIMILVIVVVIILLALLILPSLCKRNNKQSAPASVNTDRAAEIDNMEQGTAKKPVKEEMGTTRLAFVKESRERFELQDLLRASAEVLGSGNFGSSYKAVLMTGPSVVVKRFKEMNGVAKEDFFEHMRRLGRLSHPNLLPLVAYYYRKEEKLLITDYVPNGSLAHMLHGNRGSNIPSLQWPARLKIVKGVARGLAYLYEELPVLTLPHGHIKSSNVLISETHEALLTDYALVPVMNQTHASQVMVAYKSPEATSTGKPSKKSDIWSLGILIIEILTGKFPATYLQKGKASDLAGWVKSVVEEDKEHSIFDSEMNVTKSREAEMAKLLEIGLRCCEEDVEKRLELKEVVEKIEELKDGDINGVEDESSFSR